jgi:nucleoid-associated protein YejK
MAKQQIVQVIEASEPVPISAIAVHQERHMKLMELAITSKADMASIQMLADLQDKYEAKEAKKAFFAALSRFQSDMPVVKKQGKAGFAHKSGGGSTSYSYAKLEDIAKAIRPYLAETGLSYRYEQIHEGQAITINCIVMHGQGHHVTTSMTGFADASGKKNPIQQIASTVSYLRRYTLTGALGITVADEDDDAQACAQQPTNTKPQAQQQTQEQPGYSWDSFNANLPKWDAALKEGKISHDQIIDMCNSKAKLSSEQVNIIRQIMTGEKPF